MMENPVVRMIFENHDHERFYLSRFIIFIIATICSLGITAIIPGVGVSWILHRISWTPLPPEWEVSDAPVNNALGTLH